MKVSDISELVKGKLAGDGEREIRGIAGLDVAGPEYLLRRGSARRNEGQSLTGRLSAGG